MQQHIPIEKRAPSRAVQAVTFLVIHQKHKKSLEEITNDLCPVLSVQQLYRISTMYWDDRYNTETVAHEVRRAVGCLAFVLVSNPSAADCLLHLTVRSHIQQQEVKPPRIAHSEQKTAAPA